MAEFVGGNIDIINEGDILFNSNPLEIVKLFDGREKSIDSEPRFPQMKKLELKCATTDLHERDIIKNEYGGLTEIMRMDLKTIYKVNGENVEELEVFYSCDDYVYYKIDNGRLASINIENIITDPSAFKKKYVSCCYLCLRSSVKVGYFQTRKLAEDFIKAYKTYGEKWYIEDAIAKEEDYIEYYKNQIDETEKKIGKANKKIAEYKAKLEEIINGLSRC